MIVEISNGICKAKVSSLGGELVSFEREDGFEALWQGDPKFWAGQAPVLFPMVGALRNGKATIGGEWFEMAQHGFARRQEYELTDKQEDRVSFTLKANELTKTMYPFDFAITNTYILEGKSVITHVKIENLSDTNMPFCIGGHPGFTVPMAEGEAFEDYIIEFSENETQSCPMIDMSQKLINEETVVSVLENSKTMPINHEMFEKDAFVFENLNSTKVAIKSTKSSVSLELDFAGFPMLGIWSAAGQAPFVALEPWVGCATTVQESDIFENKKYMKTLKMGEEFSISFKATYSL